MLKSKKQPYPLILLIIIYLLSHTTGLATIPPYLDEALHIRRAIGILSGDILLGAEQGKWLGTVLFVPFVWWPGDPLWVARLGTVLYGVGTLLACYAIGQALFSRRVGLLAALVYTALPYVFFYNRLALTDGSVSLFAGWTIFFSIKTVRTTNILYPLLLTLALVATVLTKLTGMVFLMTPVLAVWLLTPADQSRQQAFKKITPGLLAGAVVVSLIYFFGLGLREITTKTESISSNLLLHNITLLANWLWILLTPPLAVLLLFSLLRIIFRGGSRTEWFLVLNILLVLPFLLKAWVLYPRYLLFITLPISLLIGHQIDLLTTTITQKFRYGRALAGAGLGFLLIWPVTFNVTLSGYPHQAALPAVVKDTYFSGLTAGYGIPEMGAYLQALSESEPNGIHLIRLDCWGHLHNTLPLYLPDSDKISMTTIRPADTPSKISNRSQQLRRLITERRTFFMFSYPPACYTEKVVEVMRIYFETEKLWSWSDPEGNQRVELWELTHVR